MVENTLNSHLPVTGTPPGDDCPIVFSPVPFSRLLAEAPEVEYQVEGCIPTGTSNVLGAEPGAGKTFVEMDLAIAVATGTPWLNHFPARQGTVLVFDEENARALLRKRGMKLLRGRGLPESGGDLPIHYLAGQGLNLSEPGHIKGVDALLREYRPSMVLIDSLIRVHRGNENSATEMAAVFSPVRGLMDTHGCAFLFTHHTRKLGMYNEAGQMLRGSSEIKAFVDNFFYLRKVGKTLQIEHTKPRYGEPVPTFLIEIIDPPDMSDATIVRWAGEAQVDPQDRQQEAEAFILEVLTEGQIARQGLLRRGKEAKFSPTTIDRAIKALEATGQVDRDKRGREAIFVLKKPSSPSSPYIGDDDDSATDNLLEVHLK